MSAGEIIGVVPNDLNSPEYLAAILALYRDNVGMRAAGVGGIHTRVGEAALIYGVEEYTRHRIADGWSRDQILATVSTWVLDILGELGEF